MKTASITEAKNQLSALLERVRHGETILILDRGRPVARLEPVRGCADVGDEAWLGELERRGVIRRPAAPLDRNLLLQPPPRLPAGASALQALLEEREEGR
jgi:prevent-host-death family protein